MVRSLVLVLLTVLASAFAAGAVAAQDAAPPAVPLWRLDPNGDAIQTGLGFALPQRLEGFERIGFTSTRPDGASVAAHYRRADGPLNLRILIQLRADVRGLPLPGADALDRNWPFVQAFGAPEYVGKAQGEPDELAAGRLSWGDTRAPNARMQLRRYRVAGGNAIQGLWYRNIGLWAVVIAVSGPEGKRADIEAAAQAAMTRIPWPEAPVTADLHATEPLLLRDLRDCDAKLDRSGTGTVVEPGVPIASLIAIALKSYFIDGTRLIPSPATDRGRYCRIESFPVGKYEVVALAWTGDTAGFPAARYAFLLKGHGALLQFESFFTLDGVAEAQRRGIKRLVWLTSSGTSTVVLLRVLTDWPSYEQAKALVTAIDSEKLTPLARLSHPAGRVMAAVDQAGGATAAPPAAPPH